MQFFSDKRITSGMLIFLTKLETLAQCLSYMTVIKLSSGTNFKYEISLPSENASSIYLADITRWLKGPHS